MVHSKALTALEVTKIVSIMKDFKFVIENNIYTFLIYISHSCSLLGNYYTGERQR